MLNFISFGSGSSGNSYLLYNDSDALLIDSGIGVRQLKKNFFDYGLRRDTIKAILVTHDHADHVKSVGVVSSELHVPVFATSDVHLGIQKNYCVRKKIESGLVRYVEKGKTFQIGSFSVSAFGVPHDSLDNVGYCVDYKGMTFCLMTDIGEITQEIRSNISRANYLVIEANHDEQMLLDGPYPRYLKERVAGSGGHLSNRVSATVLEECATETLRHVWLCHLSEENNHPELVRKTFEQMIIRRTERGRSTFTFDILKRKVPTGPFQLG